MALLLRKKEINCQSRFISFGLELKYFVRNVHKRPKDNAKIHLFLDEVIKASIF